MHYFRALINEVKLLLRLMKTRRADRALRLVGIDTVTLIPSEDLRTCGLKKVERFVESREA
jgi:hypothetical protein